MLGCHTADWSEADRLLAIALTLDEHDRCVCGCGGYADVTLSNDGMHGVKVLRCDAKAAVDTYNEDNPDAEPGEIRVPVWEG